VAKGSTDADGAKVVRVGGGLVEGEEVCRAE
jgi:hypothetical protein